MHGLFQWCYKNFLLSIAFIIIGTGLAITQLDKIYIDPTLDKLLNENDPAKETYRIAEDVFGSDNITTIYVEDDKLFTQEKLARLENFYYELESIAELKKVESLFNSPNFHNEDGTLVTTPSLDPIPYDQPSIDAAIDLSLKNPIFINQLVSKDKKAMTFIIYPQKANHSVEFNLSIANQIKKLIEIEKEHFQHVFQVGSPIISKEFSEGMKKDQINILPISILIIVSFIFIMLKSLTSSIIPILTGSLSLIWTMGFMGYTGIPIQLLIMTVPALLFIIGSTEDTHIIAEYLEGLEHENDKEKALIFTGKKVGIALLLTSLTTGIGFSTIILNDIEMVKEFGKVASFGIFVNFFITVTVIPVYIRFFSPQPKPKKEKEKLSLIDKIVNFVLKTIKIIIFDYPKVLFATILGVFIVLGSFINDIKVDTDYLATFKQNNPLRMNVNYMNERFSGINNFFIVLDAPEGTTFKNSPNLKKVFEIHELIENSKDFDSAQSLGAYIALLNREMTDAKPESYFIPTDDNLISQYMLFLARDDIERYVSADYKKANVVVRYPSTSSYESLKSVAHLEKQLDDILQGTNISYHIISKNILSDRASTTLVASQINSLSLLFVTVFFMMLFLFQDLKVALITLIPNAIPLLGLFGVMGLFGVPLDVGTCIISTIAIGVAADDTIHFFTRFNQFMQEESDQKECVAKSLDEEVRPMMTTSLSLMTGLSILCVSQFVPIIEFGALTAATMFFALTTDLFITPLLLSQVKLRGTVTLYDLLSLRLPESFISNCKAFHGLKIIDIKRIILLSRRIELKNDTQFSPKKECLYIVLEGKLKTSKVSRRKNNTGEDVDLAEYSAGSVISQMNEEITITTQNHTIMAELSSSTMKLLSKKLRKSSTIFEQNIKPFLTQAFKY